jgi:glycosyltransferase involved in cell wall biosynthesis
MKCSIIIANYNHRDYVGSAISSAPDKEVIDDDASTDASRELIDGFGNRVAAYFRAKPHQLGPTSTASKAVPALLSSSSMPTMCTSPG